jgi:hypothetical protein
MRKGTAAESSPRMSVRGEAGYCRPHHAQTGERGLKGQLAIGVVALTLTSALAACASAVAPGSAAPSAQVRSAGQAAPAAGSSRSSAPAGTTAGPASHADILAEARRVKCPALDGAMSPWGGSLRARPIPAGFRPVAVIECIRVPAIVPVDGPQPVEMRRVAVSGLGRLVAALRLPSTPRSRGLVPACLVPDLALPWLVFIGPGDHLLHPRVPIGACGLPIVPVLVSLRSLHWKTLSTTTRVPVDPGLRVSGSPFPNITPAVTAANPGASS